MTEETITDADRYPTLSADGARMLAFLREHPSAPMYRNRSGNRLTASDVARVRSFEAEVEQASVGWHASEQPPWVDDLAARCYAEVPFYRDLGAKPPAFGEIPTISRADLSRDVARFVPDSASIERMINFRTSGTTGHALLLPSHPVVAASYLTFHKRALRRVGIELAHGRGQVGVVLVGWQRRCFTYVSVTPTMDESGLAKINLHPSDWRDPADRVTYLDALAPEIYAGDPISFAELAELPLRTRPRALLSTSMTLTSGMRRRLENRFGCPVLDLYSLNEAGPVAVADEAAGGHVLLQHRMYVEILSPTGHRMPLGERGEITLTGGFNFCLPLLRYRTGDYAALRLDGREPLLVGLEGRPPVRFRSAHGEWLNNIEVTHALGPLAITQFALHQDADGKLRLRVRGARDDDEIRESLGALFGDAQPLEITTFDEDEGKVVQYTSALGGAEP
jgi:phenylacetate-CoA ligase